MARISLEPLNILPSEFLGAFFKQHENVCPRIIDDVKPSNFVPVKLQVKCGHLEKTLPLLQEHNNKRRGIFFVVNFGGHEGTDIKRINAQFVDIDHVSMDELVKMVESFPLEPSLIVKTKRGLHIYWLMKDDANIQRFSHIQKQLVKHFNGDPNCVDLPRVMRIPGFYHHKEEPLLVECVKFNPELRYTQDQLSELLPEVTDEEYIPKEESKLKNQGSQPGKSILSRKCPFFNYCKKNSKILPEPLWYAMITNLAVFEGGRDAIHLLSKDYPKYSEQETDKKIAHALKDSKNPMTCRYLFDHGFKCPKAGKCKAKAPAGLALIPLEIDELTTILGKCKVDREKAKNIVTARVFVETFMYNIDPGIAEVFVNNNIRDYFGFNGTDVKGLAPFQKEIYNKFSSIREVKEDKYGEELEPWYEYKKNGELRYMMSVCADWIAENEPIIYVGEGYYQYENGVWLPKTDIAIENHIRKKMKRDRYKTSAQITDTEHQLRMQVEMPSNAINPNAYLVNCRNKMLNVQTWEIFSHDPKYLSTIQINANYDETAKCPEFLKYLKGVLPESEHPLIQEMLGYSLIPVRKAQKCFLLVGKKDSGKSTLLYTIQDVLLGHDNTSVLSWQNMDDKFQTWQLFGKLANVFADLPGKELQDSSIFKAITGEDWIMGQKKHKDGFSFKPVAVLIFSCNKVPKNYHDRTDAFYGRLILIRLDNSIPEAKQDKMLKEKLMLEADGILTWALEGLKRLMKNNYRFSETERTKAEVKKYMTENSAVLLFLEERCAFDPDYMCSRTELYDAYTQFCEANRCKTSSVQSFHDVIEDTYGNTVKHIIVGKRHCWSGMKMV